MRLSIAVGSDKKRPKQDRHYNGVTLHIVISNDLQQDRDKIIKKVLKFYRASSPPSSVEANPTRKITAMGPYNAMESL